MIRTGCKLELPDGHEAFALGRAHDEAATNRAMISRARRVIVVADGSKVGKLALARICDAEAVDELITGESADAAELTRLETAGMTVTRT